MVRARLVNEYGKTGQLQDLVQVAKMYEEEEELVNKKREKKDQKIKKVIYKSDYSTDSSSAEEHLIRKFERRSRRYEDRNHHAKEDNSKSRSRDYSVESKTNSITPKHQNEEKPTDNKLESPKKTVSVNEQANISYTLRDENSVEQSNKQQKYYGRCYNCDGKFHTSKMCPFGRKSTNNQSTNGNFNSDGRQRSKSAGTRD